MATSPKGPGASALFILLTLLLGGGLFLAASADRIPFAGNIGWLLAIALLGVGIGLFLHNFPVRFLLVALPLATLIAWSFSNRIWPGASLTPENVNGAPPAGLVSMSVPGFSEAGKDLFVPQGTCVGLFADRLRQPRMLLHRNGWILVSEPRAGRIVALRDADGDGVAEQRKIFADNLNLPHGLANDAEGVVVAETGKVLLLFDRNNDLVAESSKVLTDDLPAGGGHWTRSLVRGAKGELYLSVGSDCNACLEEDPRRGTILVLDQGRGQTHIYATGLRNSVGLAIQPVTGELWASDNGRDRLGDDLPPDEINHIVAGGDYGWPWCFGDRISDPELGTAQRCRSTIPAAVELPAHVAPLGITFGEGLDGPTDWRDDLFVAEHGSWNRSVPVGYQVVRIPFSGGRPAGPPMPLVTGWLHNGRAWGRPVDVLIGPDGAIYVSDDLAGVIYRIRIPRKGAPPCGP